MSSDPVKQYYASFGEREWARLESSEGFIEFAVNTHFIEQYLPPGARVLDLGGGPGRYSQWLGTRGYRVTLADLSPELLELARARVSGVVDELVEADARDLARWRDSTFDAALVLGPLYHLTEEADRARAVEEVTRVVRPGGVVCFALIPRLGFVRRTAGTPDERHHLLDPRFMSDLLERGVFTNDRPGRFTHGWGVGPAEIAPWFERFGLETLALVSSESLASGMEPAFFDLRATDPAAYDAALEVVLDSATDPSIHGLAKHLLYIARRR